jgi:DNA-directed RNA polymerase subunit alpha
MEVIKVPVKRELQDLTKTALSLQNPGELMEKNLLLSPLGSQSDVQPMIEIITQTDDYGRFLISPLQKGYGTTVGNSLRRVLLSGLPGTAITYVKIEGVLHEFSTLPGILEDTTEIILNFKKVRFRSYTNEPKILRIDVKGEHDVTAKDIQGTSEIEVLNPDYHIATLTEKNARLAVELGVAKGKGFVSAEEHPFEHQIGLIPIDSIFSPVYKVNYFTEDTRVGQSTNYEKLHIEVWTDKSLRPDEALAESARLLTRHFELIMNLGKESVSETSGSSKEKSIMDTTIEELELSVRSYNCLKRANIQTMGDLVRYSEEDLMNVRNFGAKSLDEINDKLKTLGLSLRKEEMK